MADHTPLSAEAVEFLSTLQGADYPTALVAAFPRIVNTIVLGRRDKVGLREYFDSLLRDTRGGRKGFPLGVLMDIQALRDLLIGHDPNDKAVHWV